MLAAGLVDVVLVADCPVVACPPADATWLPEVVAVLDVGELDVGELVDEALA